MVNQAEQPAVADTEPVNPGSYNDYCERTGNTPGSERALSDYSGAVAAYREALGQRGLDSEGTRMVGTAALTHVDG